MRTEAPVVAYLRPTGESAGASSQKEGRRFSLLEARGALGVPARWALVPATLLRLELAPPA
jgi:hypothetical protein